MPILSLLRKGKEGKGMEQLPVQHQLSETFSGGETPLPVRLQRLITSLCWRRALLLLDPGGGSTGSLSGPALVLQLRLFFSLGYSLQWILPFFSLWHRQQQHPEQDGDGEPETLLGQVLKGWTTQFSS